MSSLAELTNDLWLWVAVPLLALAGLVLTLLLRAPQLARLREGVRAVRLAPPGEGEHPARAIALSSAASLGAGAVIAGATAISLGGAGALAWLWIAGFVIAPLRVADVLLARTSPPGRAGGGPSGSLAARLGEDGDERVRWLGILELLALVVASSIGIFAIHASAVAQAAEIVAPEHAIALGVGVAAVAALFVAVPRLRAWLAPSAGASLVVLVLAGILASLADPTRALGAIPRALGDLVEGPTSTAAFSGASPAEVLLGALAYVVPPLVLTLGIDGALFARVRGSTKAIAASAALSTLIHVLVASSVGIALVATGAYARRVEGERALTSVRFVEAPFDSVSQRLDPDRAWRGYLRVIEGRPQAAPLDAATERGMIAGLRYLNADGTPGNFALRVEGGRAAQLLVPDAMGALERVDPREMAKIRVAGRMLGRGAPLVAAAMRTAAGEPLAWIVALALLALAASGLGAFGVGLERSVERRLGAGPARFAALLPALALAIGVALSASAAEASSTLGLLAAALVAIVASAALLAKGSELGRL